MRIYIQSQWLHTKITKYTYKGKVGLSFDMKHYSANNCAESVLHVSGEY